MRVSVVICTFNRAHSLGATLESLRHQSHGDVEVVVVNGPSTDDTDLVLAMWADRIRIVQCPLPNLSMSRNIGIRAAGGDIVAFIDDDALPEFDWLVQALPAFADSEVAGVGGIVFDHTGLQLQYRYSASNRFGDVAVRQDRPYDEQCFPGSFQFPYLQGTNALFRRDALLEIGGFDEIFDYYLDETDVCCRLIDAGFTLRQLADAPVHHKFLASSVRDHQRVITNWYPIVKNQVYFSYRHALGAASEWEIHQNSDRVMAGRIQDAALHERAGRLPGGSAEKAAAACAHAFRLGVQLGHERHALRLGPVDWPRPEFHPFAMIDGRSRRKITIVSSGYAPNMTGGIARFITDLAPALARRGHEVRVITKAVGHAAVDLEEGVWVHRVDATHAGQSGVAPEVFDHVNDFATAAVEEVARIAQWSAHDVVYGPLWDVEVLGVLRRTGLPVVVQVATPLAVAADMAGMLDDAGSAASIGALVELENEVLAAADLFHANSAAVQTTMEDRYGAIAEPARWQVVHLGLVDRSIGVDEPPPVERIVLFVGRFEVRKGVDTFFAAVEQLADSHPDVRFVTAGEDRPLGGGQPMFGASWLEAHRDERWIGQVRMEGVVSDERLHELYTAAEIVVLPSRYESFGLVVVEAMMHGKPVVSTDTSGIRDVVRSGVDGVLVEPSDSLALATAIRALLADRVGAAVLGRAARTRFLEAFHVDSFAARFESFVDRTSLRDASRGAFEPGAGSRSDASVLQRSRFGYAERVLRAGDSVVYSAGSDIARRIVVEAREASTVVVQDGSTSVVPLSPGTMSRITVDPLVETVRLTVAHGVVIAAGLIAVS
ncbi:MAG: hypothetical protein JWM47_4197 [Acidimicrobiales bacterium]|nr:hypothetical protein [Acidimicrobiales bacterium]